MESFSLIPTPDAIPVNWLWFQILLTSTFVFHLLFMNTMVGTGIIAFVSHLRKNDEADSKEAAVRLPYIIAFAVNLGIPPLLFLSVIWGNVAYASTVLMALWWMLLVPILIIAYYGAYLYRFRFDKLGQFKPWVIGGSTVLLMFVGFIFTNNFSMMLRPDTWTRYFDNPGGTLLNLNDITMWPRYLHFMVASVAVGGLFKAVWASRKSVSADEISAARVASGMRWFLWATSFQIFIGVWFLFVQPSHIIKIFMGQSVPATVLLSLGVTTALASLFTAHKKKVALTAWLLILTVTIMAICREILRHAALASSFTPSSLKVQAEYSPLILFLISAVIGGVFSVYIIKLVWSSTEKGGER